MVDGEITEQEIGHLKRVCETAGVIYAGLQKVADDIFVLFTDEMSGNSTLMVNIEEFTNVRVQVKLRVHRNSFKKRNLIYYRADIFDAIKFITKEKVVPRGVLMDATNAAVDVLDKFFDSVKSEKSARR